MKLLGHSFSHIKKSNKANIDNKEQLIFSIGKELAPDGSEETVFACGNHELRISKLSQKLTPSK